MFESLKLKHRMSKADFEENEDELREALIESQLGLLEDADASIVILLSGLDMPGRVGAARRLMGWMDSRHIHTYAAVRPSDTDRAHPRLWRFWRELPAKGRIGLFMTGWYEELIADHILERIDDATLHHRLEQVRRFEELLVAEGAILLKFLFYLREDDLKKLARRTRAERELSFKVSDENIAISKQILKRSGHVVRLVEQVVTETSSHLAPWLPVASDDPHYRDASVCHTLIEAIEGRERRPAGTPAAAAPAEAAAPPHPAPPPKPNILDSLDLGQALARPVYRRRLAKAQRRLTELTVSEAFESKALVLAFEGNDAAGKGGAIRRVVQALDPRMVNVVPIAAPSPAEKARPYLWRFWREVPARGSITVFDRSWYGRVLVERVEGYASEADWQRAYGEIRAFERELEEAGVLVMKFWLAIDAEEQLRRFQSRESVDYKRYKITDEDWRNRGKWEAYRQAVHDMVDQTGTAQRPWTLVEANDKRFARVKVVESVVHRLERELE